MVFAALSPASSALKQRGAEPSRLIKVLLDARKLGDGGIGVYIENLMAGLSASEEIELSVIAKPGARERFEIPDRIPVLTDNARSYSLDEMFRLSRRIDFSAYDLFHEPHYTLPYGVTIPAVVTIHDLIHLRHPEKPFIPHLARFFIRSALKRASRVVTVSKASFDQLSSFAHSKPALVSKLRLVPNSLDPFFLEPSEGAEAPHQRSCGRYFLAVLSNLKPHKGVPDLIKAFEMARGRMEAQAREGGNGSRGCADLKLVLLGEGTESMVDRGSLLELAAEVKGVKIVGRVSKEELKAWYAGALALVVASKDEGFCLPVIEAQAVGTPVIARPVPAVRDLLSGRDVLCENFTIESLAGAMKSFLAAARDENEDRTELSAHLENFSRASAADRVTAIYREILQPGG